MEEELESAARVEKEALVDVIDSLKAQLDELCARMLPETVSDILSEWATVWTIDEGEPAFEAVADSLGCVAAGMPRLHCAQDINYNWRWLEDPSGTALPERPSCLRRSGPMSFRMLADRGLNVIAVHRMVAPRFLVSFAEVVNWEQAAAAVASAAHALKGLQEDGWQVDNGAFCSDETQLLLVKKLPPLRSMQHDAVERLFAGAPSELQLARERTLGRSVPQRAGGAGRRKKTARARARRDEEGSQ